LFLNLLQNWRTQSWTYWANIVILIVVIFFSGLTSEAKSAIVMTVITNMALREKTQKKVENGK